MKTTLETTEKLQVQLSHILTWDKNPRKYFDPVTLNELAENIKVFDVLQPILLWPVPLDHPQFAEGKYFIIAGERRYRASLIAAKTEIPAIIKHVDEKTALEIAITENLQRDNVHPLDEAEAYAVLFKDGYSTSELSHKFGITEITVIQRLKLLDLISEVKKMFYNNLMKIGHALLICRLSKEQQKDCSTFLKEESEYGEFPTVSALKNFIESNVYMLLDKAPFDIKDEELVKNCTSCLLCPKRTGANALLFDDLQKLDYCLDSKCFTKKAESYLDKTFLASIEQGMPIVAGWTYGEEKKEINDRFPGVIFSDDYDITNAKGCVKAFCVYGSNAGKFVNVKINKNSTDSESSSNEPTIKEQIQKLEARIIRNRELDEEKIYDAAIQKAKALTFKPIDSFNPNSTFGQIFTLFLFEFGRGNTTDSIYNALYNKKKKQHWLDEKEKNKLVDAFLNDPAKISDEVFNIFIHDLISRYGTAKSAVTVGKRIMNLIFSLYSTQLGYPQIVEEIKAKATIREDRHTKALELLKKQAPVKKKS